MSFIEKIKQSFRNFMKGRHGADELSLALLIVGLTISIIGTLLGWGFLSIISLALYAYSIYRMLSRDHNARYLENQKYLAFWNNTSSGIRQFTARLRNFRKYKYFKCPECHARLRLPRKVGEVTVTCGKCNHKFKQKA